MQLPARTTVEFVEIESAQALASWRAALSLLVDLSDERPASGPRCAQDGAADGGGGARDSVMFSG
jgi:hypothetical protein